MVANSRPAVCRDPSAFVWRWTSSGDFREARPDSESATRHHSAEIAAELTKLQDAVTPLPFDTIDKVIRTELNGDPEKVFREIQPEPLAAASIAQVHKGFLITGEPVAIKVQRPGIGLTIETMLKSCTIWR
jgi:hypothetical protein